MTSDDKKPIAVTVTIRRGEDIISHHGTLLCTPGGGDSVGFPMRDPRDVKEETWVWVKVAQ